MLEMIRLEDVLPKVGWQLRERWQSCQKILVLVQREEGRRRPRQLLLLALGPNITRGWDHVGRGTQRV